MIITENEVIGSLLMQPELLISPVGDLILSSDFTQLAPRQLFIALKTLYEDNMVMSTKECIKLIERSGSTNQLSDIAEYALLVESIAEPKNFKLNVDLLKKYALLRDLGTFCDVSAWHTDKPLPLEQQQVLQDKIKKATIDEIIENVYGRITTITDQYVQNTQSAVLNAADGIDELLDSLNEAPDFGLPLIDPKFTAVTRGARKKKVFCVSADSGNGKTRIMVGQAVKCAIPLSWDLRKQAWVVNGGNEVTGICTTEQEHEEIQTMILATISGVNEEKIIEVTTTPAEAKRVRIAANIMKKFASNLIIWRMPDPNIKQIVSGVRKMRITHQLENLFN